MQPKNNIKSNHLFPIFGLVVLLCLAPCSIRNLIQLELDSPITKFFNKNQTTLNASTCNVSEVNVVLVSKNYSKYFPLNLFVVDSNLSPIPFVHKVNAESNYQAWHGDVTSVPYYILYKNFKDYL